MKALMSKFSSIEKEVRVLTTSRPIVQYIGWLGHQNLGDEAIHLATQRIFADRLFLYDKTYIGKGLSLRFGGNAKFAGSMLGGGSLVNREMGYLHRLCDSPASKKIIFGSGVANPKFWRDYAKQQPPEQIKKWAEAINRHVDYVSVRGPVSRQTLLDNGVEKEIHVIGDPALYLCSDSFSAKKRTGTIGINIGHSRNLLWGLSDENVLSRMKKVVHALVGKGFYLQFMPVWKEDIAVMERLGEGLPKDKFRTIYTEDTDAYIESLQNVDVFIGEKLHSVILAACSYTPVIMLEYRPKCFDFMKSMELENCNIRVDEISEDTVLGKVDVLLEKYDSMRNHLRKKCLYYKEKQKEAGDRVLALIKGNGSL